jgi:hypothetical protein
LFHDTVPFNHLKQVYYVKVNIKLPYTFIDNKVGMSKRILFETAIPLQEQTPNVVG